MTTCLRWRDGRHAFQRTGAAAFDPDAYAVSAAPDDARAKDFIRRHHYSGTYPAARLRFLLHEVGAGADRLVGAAVLGVPMQRKVLTGSFPGLEPYTESLELSRFVLLDRVAANAETWFLARCFRLAAEAGVRGVISFSDPVARTRADGSVLMPGHVGTIYQAANGMFDARRSTPRTLLIGPDGVALSPRAMQKIRARDQGWRYAAAQLVSWGAPEPPACGDLRPWLEGALESAGVRRLRHPGNLRYLFRLGRTRSERSRVAVSLRPAAYPKRGWE